VSVGRSVGRSDSMLNMSVELQKLLEKDENCVVIRNRFDMSTEEEPSPVVRNELVDEIAQVLVDYYNGVPDADQVTHFADVYKLEKDERSLLDKRINTLVEERKTRLEEETRKRQEEEKRRAQIIREAKERQARDAQEQRKRTEERQRRECIRKAIAEAEKAKAEAEKAKAEAEKAKTEAEAERKMRSPPNRVCRRCGKWFDPEKNAVGSCRFHTSSQCASEMRTTHQLAVPIAAFDRCDSLFPLLYGGIVYSHTRREWINACCRRLVMTPDQQSNGCWIGRHNDKTEKPFEEDVSEICAWEPSRLTKQRPTDMDSPEAFSFYSAFGMTKSSAGKWTLSKPYSPPFGLYANMDDPYIAESQSDALARIFRERYSLGRARHEERTTHPRLLSPQNRSRQISENYNLFRSFVLGAPSPFAEFSNLARFGTQFENASKITNDIAMLDHYENLYKTTLAAANKSASFTTTMLNAITTREATEVIFNEIDIRPVDLSATELIRYAQDLKNQLKRQRQLLDEKINKVLTTFITDRPMDTQVSTYRVYDDSIKFLRRLSDDIQPIATHNTSLPDQCELLGDVTARLALVTWIKRKLDDAKGTIESSLEQVSKTAMETRVSPIFWENNLKTTLVNLLQRKHSSTEQIYRHVGMMKSILMTMDNKQSITITKSSLSDPERTRQRTYADIEDAIDRWSLRRFIRAPTNAEHADLWRLTQNMCPCRDNISDNDNMMMYAMALTK
jgi:chemotaxis protein histidine kinase CheA